MGGLLELGGDVGAGLFCDEVPDQRRVLDQVPVAVDDGMIDAIDESLKTRPYTTLAVALGIGFLFGAMWRR